MIKKTNSFKLDLIAGIFTAMLFSAFIYLEHFGITIKLINTICGLLSLGLLLYISKRAVLVAGFFIGILWFYWIGYSFEYNGVGYLTPIITLIFAIIYMLFFGVLAFTNSVIIRAILIFGLSFFEPMDWNWLQIELLFVDSYIGVLKYQLFIVLVSLSIPNYIKNRYRFIPLLLLALAHDQVGQSINNGGQALNQIGKIFNIDHQVQKDAPLKIKLVATDIKQDVKWKRETLKPTIKMAYSEIEDAIKNGYDVVVLPESVFPLYMNKAPKLMEQLLVFSKEIAIIAGTLISENSSHYNVTYMFNNGTYKVAKKLVLVPFGEYIPLPSFAKEFINDMFFAGTSDFKTAARPTDFIIKGVKFRNAICYEATCQEIYDGDVDFVIATSNNAWFTPSIEPTLQKLLMRFYARKNGVTIYHSANYRGTGIIK